MIKNNKIIKVFKIPWIWYNKYIMEKIIITTSFGMESLIKRQLEEENYKNFEVLNGKIILNGNLDDIGY